MKNKLKKQTRDISNSTFIHCSKYFYFKSYIDFGCQSIGKQSYLALTEIKRMFILDFVKR